MEIRELMRFKGIDNVIAIKKNRIAKLEDKATSTVGVLTGMPRAKGVSDKVGDGVSAIVDEKAKLVRLLESRRKIAAFIEEIEDPEVREAIEMYVFEKRSWQNIAFELQYSESGIRAKVRRYIERRTVNVW